MGKVMRKLLLIALCAALLLCGCGQSDLHCDIAATTLPVYDFASILCQNTELTVGRLVTESVSCLHDYSLQVSQMRMIENAQIVVISGVGLEDFLDDALNTSHSIIDASTGVPLHCSAHNHEDHGAHDEDGHHHEQDPHIWLSPENAKIMAANICAGLSEAYPEYQNTFRENLADLHSRLDAVYQYGQSQLSDLTCRELITFHDGFAYLAESFDLTILEAVEEESGSEASAAELIHLVELVHTHHLPAVFTEKSGSDAAAGIISTETGADIFTLDMAMAGSSYFDAMYHNIDTLKEALG